MANEYKNVVNVECGDILIAPSGSKYRVMAVVDEIVFYGSVNASGLYQGSGYGNFSIGHLLANGYKIYDQREEQDRIIDNLRKAGRIVGNKVIDY